MSKLDGVRKLACDMSFDELQEARLLIEQMQLDLVAGEEIDAQQLRDAAADKVARCKAARDLLGESNIAKPAVKSVVKPVVRRRK